jgi:hypothetical protein
LLSCCALCCCFVSSHQEQRIRASHGIKKLSQQIKEQRLKVADRITKRIGIKPGSSSVSTRKAAAAAAAAASGQDGSSSGGEGGGSGSGSREYADNVKRGDLLAELIRRNGEELATSVEGVVERVRYLLTVAYSAGCAAGENPVWFLWAIHCVDHECGGCGGAGECGVWSGIACK